MSNIVFFGTPEFAVPILKKLIKSNFKIKAVFTQPPRRSNRGQKILKSHIHLFAEKYNLNIRVPEKLINEETYLKNLNCDLALVVAYGQIIPSHFLKFCKHGYINIHASLLPKYRGAAPIQRSIMNFEKNTGISFMKINEKLDSGPVSNIYKMKIQKNENSLSLSQRLSKLASKKIVENLNLIISGEARFIDQDDSISTYANKIDKTESKINWKKKADEIIAQINGLYPNAWFKFQDERYKILECDKSELQGNPGHVLNNDLTVACGINSIAIKKIQRQGKKPQNIKEFILGNKIKRGSILIDV